MSNEEIDVDSMTQAEKDDLCTDFTRYVVGLGLIQEVPGKEAECSFCSGFIMEFGADWYWVTAGHILEAIDTQRSQFDGFRLIDRFGRGPDKNPIPFLYDDAWRFYRNSEGLDFGAIQLSSYYRSLLAANDAVAITEAEWRSSDYLAYDHYVMVGLNDSSTERSKKYEVDAYIVSGKPNPDLIWASKIDPPSHSIELNPRLTAALSQVFSEGSIVGMSGGPIFGASEVAIPPIVAIQSAWYESARITLGCPVSVFGPMIEAAIASR